VIEKGNLVVRDGKIVSVGPAAGPAGGARVDGMGRMRGLMMLLSKKRRFIDR
jgi:cytosine/adenosine deaminase-related metal-dependent hydrolase